MGNWIYLSLKVVSCYFTMAFEVLIIALHLPPKRQLWKYSFQSQKGQSFRSVLINIIFSILIVKAAQKLLSCLLGVSCSTWNKSLILWKIYNRVVIEIFFSDCIFPFSLSLNFFFFLVSLYRELNAFVVSLEDMFFSWYLSLYF